MTKEREVAAAAAAVDRIWSNYKTDANGQIFRVDLLNAITGKRGAMDMISPSLVPIYAPAKTNNPQPQYRPTKYPTNANYGNELPERFPSKSYSIDCFYTNSYNKTALTTTTLLSNLDGIVEILPSVSVDRTNVGKAKNPNSEGSILDTSSLGGESHSLSPINGEARVESLKPSASIFVMMRSSIIIKDLQADDSQVDELQVDDPKVDGLQVNERLPIKNQIEPQIEPQPLSCYSVYNQYKTTSVKLPQNAQTEQAEQTLPPVQAEQTAETEQIVPPAQIRQPTPPTVSEIDEEELYIDIPLEPSEQTAQANSLQTQPATQTAETEQTPYEEVYDDIPLASIPLASEQTAQDNRLITPPPESKVDVSIPNQTAQSATQTAGAEQTGGTGQIMPPAQASLGYAGQVNPVQVGGPGSVCIPMTSDRVDNAQNKGCFSSCAIS